MKPKLVQIIVGLFVVICSPLPAQVARFAYVVNEGSNAVSVYRVDSTTGALTPSSVTATGSTPSSVAIDPAGRFAFVANSAETAGVPSISVYTIEPHTGALTQIPGSPFPTPATDPIGMAVHPSGKFLYVAHDRFGGVVSAYSIDAATGALAQLPGSPYPTGLNTWSVTTDPAGKFLFVAVGGAANVPVYSINPNTGALTPVPGSPFPAPGNNHFVDVVDPTGHFFYMSSNSSQVLGYSVDADTGTPTPVAGSPFAAGSGTTGVAMHPTGRFLYAANQNSQNVSAYSLDSTTGALSPVPQSPFPAGSGAFTATVDPTGTFLYVPNAYSNNISAYAINANTGALTPVPGSPFATGTLPVWMAIVDETPTAALSVLPTHGGNAGTVTVQILGSGFQNGATIKLTGLGSDIIGSNTALINAFALTTTFDLTGATPAVRNVVITNPDGTTTTLTGAFTVEQGGAAQLWVAIVGRNAIRIGTNQTFYVTYGNRGNLDSSPSIVSVVVPTAIATQVDSSQALIGTLPSGSNNILAFSLGAVPAGGSGAIPIALNTSGTIANASRMFTSASAHAATGSFQLSAFLNLLMDLPAATGADFESNLPCSFFSICDSQCASQYLAQLQAYDLAKSLFDSYVNASTAETAAFGQFVAERFLAAAKSTLISYTVGLLVPEIGLASAGGLAGEAAEQFVETAMTHIISATDAAYKGDLQTNVAELRQASLDTASAATSAATLLSFVNNDIFAPADARDKAAVVSTAVGFFASLLDGIDSGSQQYFDLRLARQNAYASFTVGAASFCRARDAAFTCHNGLVSPTPCGSPQLPPPPSDPGDDRTTITITPVSSLDPNDKVGPQGVSAVGYIAIPKALGYSVYFDNQPTATAPAQAVTVTDTLTSNLDLATLTLGPISFPNQIVTPPSVPLSVSPFTKTVDLRPTTTLLVRISASLNTSTGVLTWTFQSLDPTTNQPPNDPLAGFLPPGAEGSLFFTVMPKSTVTTGTVISNTATVVFDTNAPINTPTWSNTIDNTKPVSKVSGLPATETTYSFPVQWLRTDVGAGVQDVSVFVSDNGGPFTAWLTNTSSTQATYTGVGGHTYSFYSIARDLVGDVENGKTTGEASTRILVDTTPPVVVSSVTGTLGNNGWYRSSVSVTWSVNDPESGIASSTGCTPTTIAADTAGVTLTCSATNGAGLTAAAPVTIKIDRTPPVISGMPAAGCTLWPVNQKLVTVATITAADALSGIPGTFKVTGMSNQPIAPTDPMYPDIVITPNGSGGFVVQLRADRLGTSNSDRAYTLNAMANDLAGNTATITAVCTVPHDQGK